MKNALNKLADTVADPEEKKVRFSTLLPGSRITTLESRAEQTLIGDMEVNRNSILRWTIFSLSSDDISRIGLRELLCEWCCCGLTFIGLTDLQGMGSDPASAASTGHCL